jgi:hypothetical protein
MIFVAESPHIHEITPESEEERRPLCGAAGLVWWKALTELFAEPATQFDSGLPLSQLLDFCQRHQIAVMNAVQYPLDPKITRKFPDADPVRVLKFGKLSGEFSYKRRKSSPEMQQTLASLRSRLNHTQLAGLPIYCLGNDAEWFVRQALSSEEIEARLKDKIPHPSAWWRRGGWFGKTAREKLSSIFA